MRTIAAYTLGCKVNQYDTEAMLECFERAGYASVPFQGEADVYLVNTCTVTGTGDQKSLKTIRRVAREHPSCAIVVCGCLAQREAEAILKMDNVRLVIGVQRRADRLGAQCDMLRIALDDEQTRSESLARETGAMVTLIKEYIALPARERSAHTDVFCRQAAERLSAVECAMDGLCPLPISSSKP